MYPPLEFHRASRLALLLAATTAGLGQAAEPTLPTVEVSANATRADLEADSLKNPYRVPVSNQAGVQTFTAADIEALKPRDVFDLLDMAGTGITVTYQGRKNPYFVKERGGGTFTYIVDGAILPTVTQRILQKIPLDIIEELQIVRDSTALVLGPMVNIGASGSGDGLNTGFIIIRTRQPKKDEVQLGAAVEASAGQPTADREHLWAGKRFGDEETGGYLAGLASNNNRPSTEQRFDGQKADAQMVTGGFSYGGFKLGIMGYQDSGRFEMQRAEAGLATAATNQMKWYYDPIDTTLLTLNGSMAWSDTQSTLFSVFDTKFTQTENDTNFPPYSTSIKSADNFSSYWEKTQGFSLRHHARFGGTTIQLGAQHTRSSALGSSGPTPSTRWDSEVNGFAATVEQRLFDDQLSIDAGLRRDNKFVTSSDTTTKNSNVNMPPARALSLGARWQATTTYALNARYLDGDQGTAGDFNIIQCLQTNKAGVCVKSGTLDPETQKRKEFGVEARYSPLFNPTLTWFDVKIGNQKAQTATSYVQNGATYYYYAESDTWRTGYEFLVKGALLERTSYKTSLTHLTRNVSSNASVLATGAVNLVDFSIQHGWGPYTANASLKHVGPYNGGGPGAAGAGGSFAADQQWHTIGDYTRFDANVGREFMFGSTKAKGSLYGRNLGDTKYMTIYPWTDRGRTIGVELSLEI